MGNRIVEIDNYIDKAAPFAQPVLIHFRDLMHEVCPHIEEKIKWGMPHFDYKGPLTAMASFKAHCVVSFLKASLLKDFSNVLELGERNAIGNLGRLTSITDLPSDDVMIPLIQEAWRLNNENIKVQKKPKEAKEVDNSVPEEFTKMLENAPQAQFNFEKFSPSHRREYCSWFREAKTEETKLKRMNTAIEWLNEGKNRNWKYERK